MTDLEKANDLLRRLVDWETSNTTTLTPILLGAKAYLATQPEPVDPDLLAAREIYKSIKLGWSDLEVDAGKADNTQFVRGILAGIKYGRGA